MLSLKGRRALVTGGSRGIGAAIAGVFADAGAEVAICHLGDEDRRVNNATVADNGCDLWVQNTARNKRQGESFRADDDRMACVVAALIADDDVGRFGEVVRHLAFAFVTPLGTN